MSPAPNPVQLCADSPPLPAQGPASLDRPVFLLYRTGLAPTNGTSIELARLLAGNEPRVKHIQWSPWEGGRESFPGAVVASDEGTRDWPVRLGRGAFNRLRDGLGLRWWIGGRLNRSRLGRRLAGHGPLPSSAYVICMQESDAVAAGQLLDALGHPPYLLHILDIQHDGIREQECPAFAALIRGARKVVCISRAIAEQAAQFSGTEPVLLPASTEMAVAGRTFPAPPLSMVVSGFIWADSYADQRALKILAEAIPVLREKFPGMQVNYSGPSGKRLPDYLKGLITDHGRLPTADYAALLARSHLAYVPVTHPAGSVGRFSVPSRISDYFGAGLPVLACTDPDTGIHELLEQAGPACASVIDGADGIVEAAGRLAGSPGDWCRASDAAAAFARTRLATPLVRRRLFGWLAELEPAGNR